jgi:hypothetical protein
LVEQALMHCSGKSRRSQVQASESVKLRRGVPLDEMKVIKKVGDQQKRCPSKRDTHG